MKLDTKASRAIAAVVLACCAGLGLFAAPGKPAHAAPAGQDAPGRARQPVLRAQAVQHLCRVLRTGEGDLPSAAATAATELEPGAEGGDPTTQSLRLTIAAAVLAPADEPALELARKFAGFASHGLTLLNRTRAIGSLWSALVVHQRFELATRVAQVLIDIDPLLRYPKHLRAISLTFGGKLIEAGNALTEMLDNDAEVYGYSYRHKYTMDVSHDAAIWVSPLASPLVPFAQGAERGQSNVVVSFDLPHLEHWIWEVAAMPTALKEVESHRSEARGWNYLKLRVAFEAAERDGQPGAVDKAWTAVDQFLRENGAGASPIGAWLKVRADIAKGEAEKAYSNLNLLRAPFVKDWRGDKRVYTREAHARAGYVELLVKILQRTPEDKVATLLASIEKDDTRIANKSAVAASAVCRLQAINPQQAAKLAAVAHEAIAATPGTSVASLPYLPKPATVEIALAQLESLARAHLAILGPIQPGVAARELELRTGLDNECLRHMSYAVAMFGVEQREFAPIWPKLVEAAKAVGELSKTGGEEELAELHKKASELLASAKLDTVFKFARESASAPGGSGRSLRDAGSLLMDIDLALMRFDLVARFVKLEALKKVGRPLTGPLPALTDLATLATTPVTLEFMKAVPTTPWPLVCEMVTAAVCLTAPRGTWTADMNTEAERLEKLLTRGGGAGPAALFQVEHELRAAMPGEGARIDDILRILLRASIRRSQSAYDAMDGARVYGANGDGSLYDQAPPRMWGYPARLKQLLGQDDDDYKAWQSSTIFRSERLFGNDGLAWCTNHTALNSSAWIRHIAATQADAGIRAATFGLALGTEMDDDTVRAASGQEPPVHPSGAADIDNAAAILDTLACCYFDNGDVDKAVELESFAARLGPGTRGFIDTLKVFQAARQGGR